MCMCVMSAVACVDAENLKSELSTAELAARWLAKIGADAK